MRAASIFFLILAAILQGCSKSPAPPPAEAAVGPNAWTISFFDTNHHSAGTVSLHVTTKPGVSCLGGFEGSKLVIIDRQSELMPQIEISRAPVVKIDGDDFSFDLSGGICDAYILLRGKLSADGSASGDVSTLSLGGGRPLGTFNAVRIE